MNTSGAMIPDYFARSHGHIRTAFV